MIRSILSILMRLPLRLGCMRADLAFTSPSRSRSRFGSTPMSWPGLRITRKVEDTRPRSIACFVSISRKLAPDRFQSALFLRLQGEAKSMLEMPIADGRRRRSGSRRYRAGSGSRRYDARSEEHTSELQSLMRRSYAVFCLKKNNNINRKTTVCGSLKELEE